MKLITDVDESGHICVKRTTVLKNINIFIEDHPFINKKINFLIN